MKQTGLLPEDFDFESFIKSETKGYDKIDLNKLLFRLRKDYPSHAGLLAEQVKLYTKAKDKVPSFTGSFCLFTSKSYEQSSSEAIALFKAGRFKGSTLLDLTGGLGVDDWAFSKSFKNVVSIDSDSELNKISRYNFSKLGVKNVERLDENAYEFIKNPGHYDLVYIDADRRPGVKGKKSVTLHDSEPSILKIIDRLFELSERVLLKLSPLIDITYITKSLQNIISISVISLDNEVKEILVLLQRNYEGEITIEAADIPENGKEKYFSAEFSKAKDTEYYTNGKYFYDPASALVKSGLVPQYACEKELHLIGRNSLYLISYNPVNDFFGRKFEIIGKISFGKSKIKAYLAEKLISKANVSKRNFHLSSDEIKKLFKLKDGGEDYLFFTEDPEKNKYMYHCRKLQWRLSNTAAMTSRAKNL